MCMKGPLIIMAFDPLFGLGLRLSSCHRVIVGLVISCSKIGQKLHKRSTSKIYVQMRKRPIIGPRLGWLVILILNS